MKRAEIKAEVYHPRAASDKAESCAKCAFVEDRNWLDGPQIGRMRRILADLIRENPSEPSNRK